ncbi:RNA polymerase sigma factor [Kineococcus gynurae]|uniref:RNA polymerase sigma factor n=1 Tax=Kineococcus gynurae TaxID=452979 RepID=A0ABV5LSL2_9ACTN
MDPHAPATPGLDVDAAFRAESAALLAYAVNALGDRAAGEDALQETFVRAWTARERYSPERASPRTWLFAIARNVVVDAVRARSRRPRPVEDVATAGAAPQETAPTGPDTHAASLDRLLVVESLAKLSPEHREVLVRIHLGGASYQEVSEMTGVPVATLRTRTFYALKALRALLQDEAEGGGPRG